MEEHPTFPGSQDGSASDAGRNDAAVFLGWQKTSSGDEVPLYNVTVRNHPLFRSTVTDRTLIEHRLPIPMTPPKKK